MFWNRQKSVIRLQPGTLVFVVPDEQRWEVDLITLKLGIEKLESQHQLRKRDDATLETTTEFLQELTQLCTDLNCPSATPSIARQVWIATTREFAKMELKFQRTLKVAK